jgi:hypothetical protein
MRIGSPRPGVGQIYLRGVDQLGVHCQEGRTEG